ncbi:MAG TPA: alkaline phosphatase family protein, partial [Anaerolineaceae bacterium]|nr:alkaline phosphatase family protein [Anaerolineaceae bacterium]
TIILTSVSTIQFGYLALDVDIFFDRLITRQLVQRHGKPQNSNETGILFLEIDGLSEKVFKRAMSEGYMPTLQSWYAQGTQKLMGWEPDFTSQTGSVQAGILLGNNEEIPAFRWWNRAYKHSIRAGSFTDSAAIEEKLSTGHGLLAGGGASRGNMFSGDADESLFTISTLLNRSRTTGPGFYLFLVNPFIIARILTRFVVGVLQEWWQCLKQKIRKNEPVVSSRNFLYAFIRSAECNLLQEITTYIVICDILRGLPAIYALYAGYDDVAHYTGMESSESFGTLKQIDRYFARLDHAVRHAPRPYRIVVLSDHGQSNGGPFQKTYGITLDQLVKDSIDSKEEIFTSSNNAESWDHINTFLNESLHTDTPAFRILRTLLRSNEEDSLVKLGPEYKRDAQRIDQEKIKTAGLIVLPSGSLGLVYFTQSEQRLDYETIQNLYPGMIFNLVNHPGVGFLLVRSSLEGAIVMSRDGMYFLDKDIFVGNNPLQDYSPNIPTLLRRENSFHNCPDLIISSRYDPETGNICGFENQTSHHGGIGGPQSNPFIFYPADLPVGENPPVGAEQVHRLLCRWREILKSKE